MWFTNLSWALEGERLPIREHDRDEFGAGVEEPALKGFGFIFDPRPSYSHRGNPPGTSPDFPLCRCPRRCNCRPRASG